MGKKLIRVQYEVDEAQKEAFELLMDKSHLRTKRDLINQALTLFEWAVDEKRAGRKLASIDTKTEPNRIYELVMPSLSNL